MSTLAGDSTPDRHEHDTRARAPAADITRTTLTLFFVGALVLASLWVLRPFLPALLWATMLVVATWPVLRGLERRLGGRRGAAAAVMTCSVLLVFVMPLSFGLTAIAGQADAAVEWSRSMVHAGMPDAPDWLERVPLAGDWLLRKWTAVAAINPQDLSARITPHVGRATRWLVARIGDVGLLFVQFLLTLVLAAMLYARGEIAAAGVAAFARRLAGTRGERIVGLAGQAIRAVAVGVIGTALVQSALAGFGLFVCGVPNAMMLTAVIFMLCVAQLGPLLILAPAVAWLYWSGETVWATVLLVWALPVGALDNVLRPLLIRRGADLPLLLIFAGVIGGLLSFGLIGLFLGPMLLAVTYTLLVDWVGTEAPAGAPAQRITET